MGNTEVIDETKPTEENLEKERQELNLIIDSSPIIIFYKDKIGRFVRVNEAFAAALKMPKGKFLGKTVFDLYSTHIAQQMTDDDQEVLKSGHPKLNIIEQYESASGLRMVQTDKVPILDQNGMAIGLVGFAQDITGRKEAEEALRLSETKHRDLLDNIVELIFSVTPEGRFKYVNNSWKRTLGYSESDIVSMTIFDVIHPDFLEKYQLLFEEIKTGKDVGWISTAFVNKGGGKVIVEGNEACQYANGKLLYIRWIFRDITINKHLEEQMSRLSSALSMTTDFLVITDFDARITNVNRKTMELYGAKSLEELIGRHFLELIVPTDRAKVNTDVSDVLEKGHLECREYKMVSKNGGMFRVQMCTSLVRNADGKPMGMVRVGRELGKLN